jgi:hypothetical protein
MSKPLTFSQIYDAPGAYVWALPLLPVGSIILQVRVRVVGAGGGGYGGAVLNNDNTGVGGGGGGGGAYAEATYVPGSSLPATLPVVVGAAGVGSLGVSATPTNGAEPLNSTDGGASSFGTAIVCGGGQGCGFEGNGSPGFPAVDGVLYGPTNIKTHAGGAGGGLISGDGVIVPAPAGSGGGAGGNANPAFSPHIDGYAGNDTSGGVGVTDETLAAQGETGASGAGGGGNFSTPARNADNHAGAGGNANVAGGGGGGGGGASCSNAFFSFSGAGGNGAPGYVQVDVLYSYAVPVGRYPLAQLPVHQAVNMARPISLTGRYKA